MSFIHGCCYVCMILHMSAGDSGGQIIAEKAVWFANFSFSLRRYRYFYDLDIWSVFKTCCSVIEKFWEKIFALSGDEKPQCSIEKDGLVWSYGVNSNINVDRRMSYLVENQSFCIFMHDVWQLMIGYWLDKNASLLGFRLRESYHIYSRLHWKSKITWNSIESISSRFYSPSSRTNSIRIIFFSCVDSSCNPSRRNCSWTTADNNGWATSNARSLFVAAIESLRD